MSNGFIGKIKKVFRDEQKCMVQLGKILNF